MMHETYGGNAFYIHAEILIFIYKQSIESTYDIMNICGYCKVNRDEKTFKSYCPSCMLYLGRNFEDDYVDELIPTLDRLWKEHNAKQEKQLMQFLDLQQKLQAAEAKLQAAEAELHVKVALLKLPPVKKLDARFVIDAID